MSGEFYTGIRNQEIQGVFVAENSVSGENGDGLTTSVGDSCCNSVVACAGNLNGKRASSHSRTGKSNDWEDVGNHIEALELETGVSWELSVEGCPCENRGNIERYMYYFSLPRSKDKGAVEKENISKPALIDPIYPPDAVTLANLVSSDSEMRKKSETYKALGE